MLNADPRVLCLIGCGSVYEALIDDLFAYGLDPTKVLSHRFDRVADIAAQAELLLAQWSPQRHELFVAVDANALNHARLELYGRARLLGFRMQTLVHSSSIVGPRGKLADNVWIGPGAVIGPSCQIASNTLIGAGVRLDADVRIAAHGWIGPGTRIGRHARLGSHAVLGADVVLQEYTELGRHVLLEQSGPWHGVLDSGTFWEARARSEACMIGPGYTFERKAQS
jgi:serine acetyltransferase